MWILLPDLLYTFMLPGARVGHTFLCGREKAKITLGQAMKAQKGSRVQFCSFFNLARWGLVESHFSTALPGTHSTECWVGPGVGLAGCGESAPPLPTGFHPRTVHPVANCV